MVLLLKPHNPFKLVQAICWLWSKDEGFATINVVIRKEELSMTQNQIAYWNMQEGRRHNIVTEHETGRHNRATENIDISKLGETNRHNLATEGLQGQVNRETARHNLATEYTNQYLATEGARHNRVSENLGYGNLAELQRHNLAAEATNQQNADTQFSAVMETGRHNVETENLTAQRQEFQNLYDQVRTAYEQARLDNNIPYAEMKEIEAKINRMENQNWVDRKELSVNQMNAAIKNADTLLRMIKSFGKVR